MKWQPLLVAAACSAVLMTSPALAQPSIPAGPYGDNDSIASLRTYDQLMSALRSSVQTSQGAMSLQMAPWKSNTGRDVPYVVVGNGPTAVLIIAQQHGDEMETSDSAVNLARKLANNSLESRTIRNALTVIVMPRVNVDGFDGVKADGTPITDSQGRVPPWRQNYDPRFVTGSVPAFYQRGRGYDINRYHAFRPQCPLDNPNFPNITTGVTSCENAIPGPNYTLADIGLGNPVPEARNVRWLADRYKPVVALDMHHQGTPVDNGQMVRGSTLWPTALPTAERLEAVEPGALARFSPARRWPSAWWC